MLQLMKLEVVVEVSVETILMQQLLLLLFWSLVDGGVIGVGITFCIFTISTNHDKLKKKSTQAIRRAILFQHKFLTAALGSQHTSTASTFCTRSGKLFFVFCKMKSTF